MNFLDAADHHRLDEVYPEKTRRRLVDVKMRYDPDNLFHETSTSGPPSMAEVRGRQAGEPILSQKSASRPVRRSIGWEPGRG